MLASAKIEIKPENIDVLNTPHYRHALTVPRDRLSSRNIGSARVQVNPTFQAARMDALLPLAYG